LDGAPRHLAHGQRLRAVLDDQRERDLEDGLDAQAAAFLARLATGVGAARTRGSRGGFGRVAHH